MLGVNQVVIAGGMESMSNAPFILPRSVSPKFVGHVQLRDSMIVDGLWDPYKDISMGSCAEVCADELNISRQAQVPRKISFLLYVFVDHRWRKKGLQFVINSLGQKSFISYDLDFGVQLLNCSLILLTRKY